MRWHVLALVICASMASALGSPAYAQLAGPLPQPAAAASVAPLREAVFQEPRALAAAPPGGEIVPIDLTPVRLPERASPFEAFKAEALYRLPTRMFFSATCENSLRLETNVFQTLKRNRADGIYRVLPNVTLGYALTRTTRLSANYFFLRDQYMDHPGLSRNIHSIGFRLDQDIPISSRTNLTAGFFARQLLITNQPNLSDLIPSLVVSRRVGARGAVYSSILGQIRFRNVLQQYQEFDQFYSIGGVYRRNPWVFIFDTTLVSNFGKRALRFGPNNQVIIMTMEAGRQISSRLPVTAFVRAEPIFNIGASQATGFAGVNVRIFGGLRVEVAKPPIFPVAFGGS